VLGFLFLVVTVSAAALLVPAGVVLFRVRPGRRAHVAELTGRTRRLHLVGAGTLVGLGSLGVAALLGAGPLQALSTAALHAGMVVAWARTNSSWGVRGVVVWALQFTATVGLLGLLVHRMATSDLSPIRLVVGAVAWLLFLVGLVPAQQDLRRRIAGRADRDVTAGSFAAPRTEAVGSRRQAASLAALLVAGGTVLAVTSGWSAPPQEDPTQAGRGDSPDDENGGSSSGAPSGSPSLASSDHSAQRGDGSGSGEKNGSTDGDGTTVPPSTTASEAPESTGSSSSAPTTAESEPTKTPGYEKEKPNRPPGLPSSPGGPKP
jgi:hypothetical protein